MKRYSVKIREVHEQQIFVSAKDADDAKEKGFNLVSLPPLPTLLQG